MPIDSRVGYELEEILVFIGKQRDQHAFVIGAADVNDARDQQTEAELRDFILSAITGTVSCGDGAAEPDDQVVTH